MRIAFVVGAVALASGAAADPYDPPQPITPEALVPITPEALAQGTECGKLGALPIFVRAVTIASRGAY